MTRAEKGFEEWHADRWHRHTLSFVTWAVVAWAAAYAVTLALTALFYALGLTK